MDLQTGADGLGRAFAPDAVDETLDRHDASNVDGEHRQDRSLLLSAERHGTIVDHRFDPTEKSDGGAAAPEPDRQLDVCHPFGPQLEQMLGSRQTLQMVFTEVDQRPLIFREQLRRRGRNEHLTAVTSGANPGCSIDDRPEVVPVTFVRRPRVQPHAHLDVSVLRPPLRDELPLGVDRRGRRVRRRRERGRKPVTARREDVAAVVPDCTRDQPIVVGEGLGHRLLGSVPQHRRVLDIGEQERHRPRWMRPAHHRGASCRRRRTGRDRRRPHHEWAIRTSLVTRSTLGR